MNRILPARILLLPALLFTSACSCCFQDRFANPTRAQFLQNAWLTPELKAVAPSSLFPEIYFAPVLSWDLHRMNWWARQNFQTRDMLENDAARLAARMRSSFMRAMIDCPENRFLIVPEPGPQTLIVQMAITELVPSKPFWNAAATGAGFVVPGAGMLGIFGKGWLTIHGRVLDGGSGRTLALFQHRAQDGSALVDVSQFTWYRGAEANIDELALKMAQFLNAPADVVVKPALPLKLLAY